MGESEPVEEQGLADLIQGWLTDNENRNETLDPTQLHLRRSVKYVYPLFVFLYALIAIAGIVSNIGMLVILAKRRLYREPTYFFLGNLAFSDLIKCILVLPPTLTNLLMKNWIFGSFMCFFLPMMQSFPVHASIMTYAMIAIDRYRLIVTPHKARVPAALCTIGVWVAAVCAVLPYAVYIKYIDLGALLGADYNSFGICYVNLEKHIEEYIRAIFVTMYALPLAIISFLYVKISAEFKCRETTLSVQFASQAEDTFRCLDMSESQLTSRITWSSTDGTDHRVDPEGASAESSMHAKSLNERSTTQDSDDDLDIVKEKRTQSYMMAMVTLFAMCWCPLNILILVTYFVHENDNNRSHYDITYMTFTWFGFLSTCVTPLLFASWTMSDSTKDRLRGYFRFSNRARHSEFLPKASV